MTKNLTIELVANGNGNWNMHPESGMYGIAMCIHGMRRAFPGLPLTAKRCWLVLGEEEDVPLRMTGHAYHKDGVEMAVLGESTWWFNGAGRLIRQRFCVQDETTVRTRVSVWYE